MKKKNTKKRKLGMRIWSWLIIFMFLSTIFFFAFIYTKLSGDFYYSSLHYEYIEADKYVALGDALELDIKSDFIELHNTDRIGSLDGIYYIDVSSLKVNSFDYEDSLIDCQVNVIYGVYDEKGEVIEKGFPLFFDLKYESNKQLMLQTDHDFFDERYGYHIAVQINERINYFVDVDYRDLEMIFHIPDEDVYVTPMLLMNREVSDLFSEYLRVNKGLTSSADDSFSRMLYLSMITISTLGFGDIVPLTNIARILVGLESVMGVIYLGAFVNSIMSSDWTTANSEL